MGNRKIVVGSNYNQGDKIGPYHEATKDDVIIDGYGNPLFPESQITITNSTYVVTDTYKNILLDASSNNIDVTLPTPIGRTNTIFNFKRIDGCNHYVKLSASVGNIDNNTILGMDSYTNYKIISNGSNWYIL